MQMSSEPRKLRSASFGGIHSNVIRGIARHHTGGSMALLRYFSTASEVEKLPDPK